MFEGIVFSKETMCFRRKDSVFEGIIVFSKENPVFEGQIVISKNKFSFRRKTSVFKRKRVFGVDRNKVKIICKQYAELMSRTCEKSPAG